MLSLDDLAPRIKELRARQGELQNSVAKMQDELDRSGVTRVNSEVVKAYANDLRTLLTEMEVTRRKALLRSYIERITLGEKTGTIRYRLPVPVGWREDEGLSVPPTEPFGGAEGIRTPYLSDCIGTLSRVRCPVGVC